MAFLSLFAVEHEYLFDLLYSRLRAIVVIRPQVRHRAVEELVDDALRDHVHRLTLFVGKALQPLRVRLRELSLANSIKFLLQLCDRRDVSERFLPLHELGELNPKKQLGLKDLVPPLRLVGGDHLLQVVHVVRKHPRHVVAARLDVTRH